MAQKRIAHRARMAAYGLAGLVLPRVSSPTLEVLSARRVPWSRQAVPPATSTTPHPIQWAAIPSLRVSADATVPSAFPIFWRDRVEHINAPLRSVSRRFR
jgi:hypothetical protein